MLSSLIEIMLAMLEMTKLGVVVEGEEDWAAEEDKAG